MTSFAFPNQRKAVLFRKTLAFFKSSPSCPTKDKPCSVTKSAMRWEIEVRGG